MYVAHLDGGGDVGTRLFKRDTTHTNTKTNLQSLYAHFGRTVQLDLRTPSPTQPLALLNTKGPLRGYLRYNWSRARLSSFR